jgi:mRNA deadenylase 3'-5' endonuclease subunit Ccr4
MSKGRLEGGYAEPMRPRDPIADKTVTHPFLLSDVYGECAMFRQPFTYGRPGGCTVIDFVWASEAMQVSGVLQPVTNGQASKIWLQGIPNSSWPSDHLPLGVVLKCHGSNRAAPVSVH